MSHVVAARAVTLLAADIPLGNLFRVDIVRDGVAPVAGWAGRALHIVWRIKWCPPIGAGRDEVGAPDMIGNVPLRGFGIVVVADLGEVALFPHTAVHQRDLSLVNLAKLFFERSGRMASGCVAGSRTTLAIGVAFLRA